MISPNEFLDALESAGFDYFTGVPDSLLKDFCACVSDTKSSVSGHLIAANEGAAVALAAGHHLATGRFGVVYMQNSGLGNAVNAITSLADPEVYSIPMLLIIGWRGEPGYSDEPQHVKQGKITREMLDCLGVSYEIMPTEIGDAKALVARARSYCEKYAAPFAIVVSRGTFDKYEQPRTDPTYQLMREAAIQLIAEHLDVFDIIVGTTGKTSRELFEYRARMGMSHSSDFLTVGSMGHASQIALGIAINTPGRQVICLDGDGAAIMHMGSMAILGTEAPPNFKHIIINNGAHDSVGGQPTAGHRINFPAIAKACGYRSVNSVKRLEEIPVSVAQLRQVSGPALLEILASKGARKDLGRPTIAPGDNKIAFMRNLQE